MTTDTIVKLRKALLQTGESLHYMGINAPSVKTHNGSNFGQCTDFRCERVHRALDELPVEADEPCVARIHHGPGHQSTTECRLKGPHVKHEAVYGSERSFAEWYGWDIMSGYFDEAPGDDD